MTSSSNPIVCVINDHPSECESLAQVARSIGWQCESFSSAHDFLAHPRPFTPSCLIADISLSDMDGLELQQRLSAERPEISIIFVSDRCDVRIAVRAMKAGATEFLTKPYDRDLLLSALRQGLRRSEAVLGRVGSSRVDLQACKLEYSIVSPK